MLAQNNYPVDVNLYEWSNWGEWNSCSATCGSTGRKKRYRACINRNTQMEVPNDSEKCIIEDQVASEMEISCNEDIRCSRGSFFVISKPGISKNLHFYGNLSYCLTKL